MEAGSLGTNGLDGAKHVSACAEWAIKTNHIITVYVSFFDLDMMLVPLRYLEKFILLLKGSL